MINIVQQNDISPVLSRTDEIEIKLYMWTEFLTTAWLKLHEEPSSKIFVSFLEISDMVAFIFELNNYNSQ